MSTHEQVLAEVPTGRDFLIRVVRQASASGDVIDARVWHRRANGTLGRTRLGWTVSEAQARALAPGFAHADGAR